MRDRAHCPVKLARARNNVMELSSGASPLRAFEPVGSSKPPRWERVRGIVAAAVGGWVLLVLIVWGLLEFMK